LYKQGKVIATTQIFMSRPAKV